MNSRSVDRDVGVEGEKQRCAREQGHWDEVLLRVIGELLEEQG